MEDKLDTTILQEKPWDTAVVFLHVALAWQHDGSMQNLVDSVHWRLERVLKKKPNVNWKNEECKPRNASLFRTDRTVCSVVQLMGLIYFCWIRGGPDGVAAVPVCLASLVWNVEFPKQIDSTPPAGPGIIAEFIAVGWPHPSLQCHHVWLRWLRREAH